MSWFQTLLGDPDSNSIKTPKGVTQDYNTLRQQSLSSGRLFEDSIFAPRSSRNCEWLRPFEISSSPKFISSGVSRFDVVQGELGDCWLIAAVANLTLDQKLFTLVVPPDQSFERGSYCGIFRFRFWQFGKWVEVVIDDRLPTRDGKLLFMRSSDPDEFWSPLFEKAYAKLHGSYDALRGGTTCEAMVDLTGGLTEFFDVQTAEAPPNLFAIMKKAFERGSLIGCSIEAQDESQRENELPNGLIKGHAYSVTSVLEITVQNRQLPMLRLRNPWSGTTEWKGPWSDSSREWSMIGDYEKRRIGLVFEADGEFWISFHDFRENFTRVELCNLTPDALDGNVQRHWHAQMFEGKWIRGCTAGGCRNNLNTFAQNPQYVVTLVDPDEDDDNDNCTMIVALMQKNKRSAKKYQMGSSDLTIGFAIYALKDTGYFDENPSVYSSAQNGQQILSTDFFKYNTSVARSPTYINLREVTARFTLPPGTYAIIPSTFDKGEEGEFILRVWTEAPARSGGPSPPSNYPDIKPSLPTPQPLPGPRRPSPQPAPKVPEPTPTYPRYPTPTPPEPKDPDKKPAYPAYPSPAAPGVPGYPPYPTNPGGNFPSYPPYPAYPSLPPGGGGGDIRYPTIPDEPSIQRRKVRPPPPGPSIDISIGEVIGTVSTIISILTMCYNTYKSMSQHTAQTYPFGGNQFSAPPSYAAGGGGPSQQYPSSSYGGNYPPESFVQSRGYSMQASNPNAGKEREKKTKDHQASHRPGSGSEARSSRL
uniref:Calpain-A n=1 Tax=Aceria tosichella TaxID=561515 RepID=A0A6G1SCT2_9ACAR